MIASTRRRNFLIALLPALVIFMIRLSLPLFSAHADAPCTNLGPARNGDHWNAGTVKVYIDPNLSPAQKTQIANAISAFQSQANLSSASVTLTIASSSAPAPTSSDSGVIRFMNDPTGSPGSFAHTQNTNTTLNGALQNQIVHSEISINSGAVIAGANVPFYDASQPNADQYVKDIALHELGHAFGLADAYYPQTYTYCGQVAGSSIMNGSCGTNDQGPHVNWDMNIDHPATPAAGGVGAAALSDCDKAQISANQQTPPGASKSFGIGGAGPGDGSAPAGSSGSSSGSVPGGEGGGYCTSYDDWNEETNTLTNYTFCF